jgi:hypothetical protein
MREALKLALEALENWKHAYPDEFDEFDEDALKAIKETLAQPEQELLAWKNAALRVGEDLSSVGPKGYYNMTAQQWLIGQWRNNHEAIILWHSQSRSLWLI